MKVVAFALLLVSGYYVSPLILMVTSLMQYDDNFITHGRLQLGGWLVETFPNKAADAVFTLLVLSWSAVFIAWLVWVWCSRNVAVKTVKPSPAHGKTTRSQLIELRDHFGKVESAENDPLYEALARIVILADDLFNSESPVQYDSLTRAPLDDLIGNVKSYIRFKTKPDSFPIESSELSQKYAASLEAARGCEAYLRGTLYMSNTHEVADHSASSWRLAALLELYGDFRR